MKTSARLLLFAGLAFTLAGSCMPGDPNEPDRVQKVSSALTDSFWTPVVGSTPVVAVAQDRALVVWLAETTQGMNVVGQLFSTTTLAPIGPSRAYTTNNLRKWSPQVATSGSGFFLVYEYELTPTDHNIYGIRVGTDGASMGGVPVSVSSSSDSLPVLTYAPMLGKFLVGYHRQTSGGSLNLFARYVSTTGALDPELAIQQSMGVGPADVAASSGGTITFAYMDTSLAIRVQSINARPGSGSTPSASVVVLTPGDFPHGISLTYNPAVDMFAVASTDDFVAGEQVVGQKIRMATFNAGCVSASCVNLPTVVAEWDAPGALQFSGPSVAPLGSGFLTTYGLVDPSSSSPVQTVAQPTDFRGNTAEAANTTLFPGCPGTLPAFSSKGSGANSSLAIAVFEPRCDGTPNVYGAALAAPSATVTSFPVADAGPAFYPLSFDSGDNRRYLDMQNDWASNQYKAECAASDRVIGISATSFLTGSTSYGHSVLCAEDHPTLVSAVRHTYSFDGGGQRGDTGTGPWDPGYVIAECGSTETVTGISRVPGGVLGKLMCSGMTGLSTPDLVPDDSRCTTVPFSIDNDNQLQTWTTDWAPNFIKNACGIFYSVLKGVSMNGASGEIHSLLCCATKFQ